MKVLEYDEKKGIMRLHIEDEDDLWTIHMILNKGDKIIARTTRDVGLGNESRRVSMIMELQVEYTEFQSFTTRLRIHGLVLDAPEKYSIKGSHHTINLDIGDEIVIIKEKWNKASLDRIYRQAEKRSKVLISLVDFDEYLIAIPMSQGIKILQEKSLETPNKEEKNIIEDNAKEVSKEIENYARQYQPDAIILAGPGPFKEIVKNTLNIKNIKIYLDSVSSATRSGLNEILKRDIIDQVMRDYEISKSMKDVDKALLLLSKNPELLAYGIEEVKNASSLGAVDTLLVLEEMVTENQEVQELMEEVEKKGGKVEIVPRDSPVYFQVKNLSGIIALLRFRIH
ncbi:mRNA surveillance protein pelota [Acidianus sulfidivorans JP7]|uniref:Protein pelota homolog n=1 Tax=Acidianus sulfidivorans JP7 TaxID=619593 RepID=A0A2U9IM71_9CREN|nr:mRNA surveillance protein pelota [Acidianus sulfidivorans]AWR97126.1 mRNA surveillance protein pelota [Acidianus sulfidivorans JP7]